MTRLLILLLPVLIFAWLMLRLSLTRTRRDLSSRSALLTDAELERQTARLAEALESGRISILLLRDPSVNGFADADGRIFLTEGFMAKHRNGEVSGEELASVIAHELGHVAAGHVKRRMRDVVGQDAALFLVSGLLSRVLPFIGPWVASHAANAVMAHFSRRDEFEADTWASALLIKAGIGTGPQKSLLRKLDALTAQAGNDVPAWLRSHPSAEERIASIENNEARWRG